MKECECPTEHSVAKLGHSDLCPFFSPTQLTMIVPTLATILIGCPPKHIDGTEHDFSWASYEGRTLSTGVCRCGLRDIDFCLMRMP